MQEDLPANMQGPKRSTNVKMLPDTPHLLKNLKAAWLKFDFILSEETCKRFNLTSNIVSLEAVRKLIRFQHSNAFLIQSRLKAEHLSNNNFAKMRVQPAEAIFSHATAAGIEVLISEYGLDIKFKTTSFFIRKTANWYERSTSRKRSMAFSYKNMEEFNRALTDLGEFRDIIDTSILSKAQKNARIPLQKGIVLATNSMIDIAVDLLDNHGFEFVIGGRFTSEPVENVFSCVRKRTLHPTCREFRNSIRAFSIINQNVSKSSGYHQDDSFWLSGLAEAKSISTTEDQSEGQQYSVPDSNSDEFEVSEQLSFTYVCGYVLSKSICENLYCEPCQSLLLSDGPSNKAHALISAKEFKEEKNCLIYPSEFALKLFTKLEELFQINEKPAILNHKVVKNLSKTAFEHILTVLPNMPKCHLYKIIYRYFNVKFHRFASQKSDTVLKSQAASIKSGVYGSKSAKGHSLSKE